ncbi:hypothetical protein CORC01_00083 [Colletotrichum orchidophilum]|uniref:Uncharacterized protein n=1 Tax=Colletotrichum orchidophilum TaxID=1209926 RepID=A0A1G4BT58_9PEZI|nr:uncharacterized protein CORC01_00083 [Colletotrichum orchidophilum]OHF04612.1 hypothetical protein CORC01_00083 [Colletotrichum orchidophilum]
MSTSPSIRKAEQPIPWNRATARSLDDGAYRENRSSGHAEEQVSQYTNENLGVASDEDDEGSHSSFSASEDDDWTEPEEQDSTRFERPLRWIKRNEFPTKMQTGMGTNSGSMSTSAGTGSGQSVSEDSSYQSLSLLASGPTRSKRRRLPGEDGNSDNEDGGNGKRTLKVHLATAEFPRFAYYDLRAVLPVHYPAALHLGHRTTPAEPETCPAHQETDMDILDITQQSQFAENDGNFAIGEMTSSGVTSGNADFDADVEHLWSEASHFNNHDAAPGLESRPGGPFGLSDFAQERYPQMETIQPNESGLLFTEDFPDLVDDSRFAAREVINSELQRILKDLRQELQRQRRKNDRLQSICSSLSGHVDDLSQLHEDFVMDLARQPADADKVHRLGAQVSRFRETLEAAT